jgi:hypothetical protein
MLFPLPKLFFAVGGFFAAGNAISKGHSSGHYQEK